jgi:hypothetical protein
VILLWWQHRSMACKVWLTFVKKGADSSFHVFEHGGSDLFFRPFFIKCPVWHTVVWNSSKIKILNNSRFFLWDVDHVPSTWHQVQDALFIEINSIGFCNSRPGGSDLFFRPFFIKCPVWHTVVWNSSKILCNYVFLLKTY